MTEIKLIQAPKKPEETYPVGQIRLIQSPVSEQSTTGEPAVGEDVEYDRPSDPFKQGLAGITDIGTGLPMVLGMAGAGAEALWQDLFSAGPQNISENFARNLETGGAGALMRAGASAQEDVNEFFDIEFPVSIEDQIARSIGMFLPIPGFNVAAGASRLARLGRGTANVLTQAVGTGPGKTILGGKPLTRPQAYARRAVAQEGIGFGLDQGIRLLSGAPTVASEEALIGTPRVIRPETPVSPHVLQASEGIDITQVDPVLRQADEIIAKQEEGNTAKDIAITLGVIFGGAALARHVAKTRRASKEAAGPHGAADAPPTKLDNFIKGVSPYGPGDLLPFGDGIVSPRGRQYFAQLPGVLRQGAGDLSKYTGGAFVDRAKVSANYLRHMGMSKDTIEKATENTHVDPRGVAMENHATGKFGQGYDRETFSGDELWIREQALTPKQRQLFAEASDAQTRLVDKVAKADEADITYSSLFKQDGQLPNKIIDDETTRLINVVKQARNDDDIARLMDDYADAYDAHLGYQVHRKFESEAGAAELRKRFSTADGRLAYMPLYANNHEAFLKRFGRAFGIDPSRTGDPSTAWRYKPRGSSPTRQALGPAEAYKQYVAHSMEAANSNLYRHGILSALSGVRTVDPFSGRSRAITRKRVDKDGYTQDIGNQNLPPVDRNGSGTNYIGRGRINEHGEFVDFDVESYKKFGPTDTDYRPGTGADLMEQSKNGQEVMFTVHNGEVHAWHVPDALLRSSLDLSPKLGPLLHFMNHWKSVFTAFTTGKYSAFGVKSHIFASQQVMTNTIATKGFKEGLKTLPQGVRASGIIFGSDTARDISNYLAFRIATNTGMAKIAPDLTQKLQGIFERRVTRRFKDASDMLSESRRETGRGFGGNVNADTFLGTPEEFARAFGGEFSNYFGLGQMQLVWKMWKNLNTAFHEGPALGVELAHIGKAVRRGEKLSPQLYREASEAGKSMAGDMRRIGASGAAKAFNASVPFSAAMIQSWNSIISAAKAGGWSGFAKFNAGLATVIGLPTITELAYTAMLSEIPGEDGKPMTFVDPNFPSKVWTYNSYLHEGFTAQQKASNFIVMIPGRPPWEAVLIPVSPEWGFAKGIMYELADAVFNFSDLGTDSQLPLDQREQESQLKVSAARVLDIPVPPPVGSALALMGIDLRLGPTIEESADPDNPGTSLSIAKSFPLGTGERVSRRSGESRNVADTLDTSTAAAIAELTGATGTAMIRMVEELVGGITMGDSVDDSGSIGVGLENAAHAFGDGLAAQNVLFPSLFGKRVTHPNERSGLIARRVFNNRRALDRMFRSREALITGGRADPQGYPTDANTVRPDDDPITIMVAQHIHEVSEAISKHDKDLAYLKRERTRLGRSTNMSVKERQSKIDSIAVRIEMLLSHQLAEFIEFDKRMSRELSQRLQRPIEFSLATHVPRANISGPRSTPSLIRNSLQTSQ